MLVFIRCCHFLCIKPAAENTNEGSVDKTYSELVAYHHCFLQLLGPSLAACPLLTVSSFPSPCSICFFLSSGPLYPLRAVVQRVSQRQHCHGILDFVPRLLGSLVREWKRRPLAENKPKASAEEFQNNSRNRRFACI